MPRRPGRPSARDPHPHSRLWLGAVALLAAPAILSSAVFLPMPGWLPMSVFPVFSALLRVARAAPLWAVATTAALVFAWRGDSLSERHRLVALGIVVLAWLVGVTTAGRLAVATGF